MEIMRKTIMMGMVLLPSFVFAATDCRVIEYPDHYEAVCTGNEKPGPVSAQTPVKTPTSVKAPITVQVKTPDVARTLKNDKTSEVAQSPEISQSPDTIQLLMSINPPVAAKIPVLVAQSPTAAMTQTPTEAMSQASLMTQTAVSSPADVGNAPFAAMRRSARTTEMEAAIVARKRLILELQSNKD